MRCKGNNGANKEKKKVSSLDRLRHIKLYSEIPYDYTRTAPFFFLLVSNK